MCTLFCRLINCVFTPELEWCYLSRTWNTKISAPSLFYLEIYLVRIENFIFISYTKYSYTTCNLYTTVPQKVNRIFRNNLPDHPASVFSIQVVPSSNIGQGKAILITHFYCFPYSSTDKCYYNVLKYVITTSFNFQLPLIHSHHPSILCYNLCIWKGFIHLCKNQPKHNVCTVSISL
jgi:hypothetical protein